MQELSQALDDMKVLHQEILGRPAPELGPQSYFPFPVGVDPLRHALHEVQRLKEISKQVSAAPRSNAWAPNADCFMTDDEFIVRIEVPGVSREDLKVFIVGGECVVRGEKKPVMFDDKTRRPLTIESPWGPFERRFGIPRGCRVDEMKARTRDGVLELRIPAEELHAPEEREFKVS